MLIIKLSNKMEIRSLTLIMGQWLHWPWNGARAKCFDYKTSSDL